MTKDGELLVSTFEVTAIGEASKILYSAEDLDRLTSEHNANMHTIIAQKVVEVVANMGRRSLPVAPQVTKPPPLIPQNAPAATITPPPSGYQ